MTLIFQLLTSVIPLRSSSRVSYCSVSSISASPQSLLISNGNIRSINTSSTNSAEALARQVKNVKESPQEVGIELPVASADDSRVAVGWPDGIWSR
jgi:hypothetical protein